MDCFRILRAPIKYPQDVLIQELKDTYNLAKTELGLNPDLKFLFACLLTQKLSSIGVLSSIVETQRKGGGFFTSTEVLPCYPKDTLSGVSVEVTADNKQVILHVHTHDNQTFDLWLDAIDYYMIVCFGISAIHIKTSHNKDKPVELLEFCLVDSPLQLIKQSMKQTGCIS